MKQLPKSNQHQITLSWPQIDTALPCSPSHAIAAPGSQNRQPPATGNQQPPLPPLISDFGSTIVTKSNRNMGKKGSSTAISGPQMSVTIREASTGKKHTNTNAKTSLKLQHIKNLAMWATHDAAIPSLGAFFGHHFAASSEALVTPVDPSLFTCQRCETILHPGYNCTIRIEKNKKNNTQRQKGKKASHNHQKNNIVYTCHFCSHRNMKRGTPRNTNPPKPKPHPNPNTPVGSTTDNPDRGKVGNFVKDNSADITKGSFVKNDADPATPKLTLESKMKKRNRSGSKKKVAYDPNAEEKSVNASSSKRKRRKSWTSLKEIAECNENENARKLMKLTIPFSIE